MPADLPAIERGEVLQGIGLRLVAYRAQSGLLSLGRAPGDRVGVDVLAIEVTGGEIGGVCTVYF